MKKTCLISSIVLCIGSSAVAVPDAFVVDVLKQTTSARIHGMANSFTAIAEEESAVLVNPAGLAYPGASYSYQTLDSEKLAFKNAQAHYYYNKPFGFSSVLKKDLKNNALTMTALGFGVSGGRGVSWGLNYKHVEGHVNNLRVDGWSSDLGLLFHLFPWMKLGVMVQDVYAKGIDIDPSLKVGLAGLHEKRHFNWSIETSYKTYSDKDTVTQFGLEYSVAESLSLRGGIQQKNLFSGASIYLPWIKFDLGVSNHIENSEDLYYSMAFHLGQGAQIAKQRRRYARYKRAAYAEFAIGGNIKKGRSEVSLLGGYKIGSNDLLTLINMSNEDPGCEGYIIRVGNMSSSLTSIGLVEEIREELLKAKQKGKRVIIYFEGYIGLSEYYLGSIADMLIMPPMGSMSQMGLAIEVQKARQFLEKLGIQSESFTSGIHKAITGSTSDQLTALNKSQLTGLLEDVFQSSIKDIEQDRSDIQESLAKLSDGSMITAKEALKLGLVDRLAYWPEVYSIVDDYGENLEKLSLDSFAVTEYPSLYNMLNRIAIVEVDGPIMLGDNATNILFGGQSTGADEFDKTVNKLEKDRTVRGVVIRINSPGGSVLASDRIHSAIDRLKASGKTVYTSMGAIATSGGYYIAANSDKIFANGSSITGSIGVMSSLTSYYTLGEELGIKRESLKTGKYMDLYHSSSKIDADEKAMIQMHQDSFYQEFVQKVKIGRNMTEKEVYNVAQGHIITGRQAKEVKLVDELGGLYEAVDALASKLEIEDPSVVFMRSRSKFKVPFSKNQLSSLFKKVSFLTNASF